MIRRQIHQLKRLLFHIFRLLPIKNEHVLFESYIGLSYGCNPKYIYEQLIRSGSTLQCIWSLQKATNHQIPGTALVIKRFSIRYYYHLATAKHLISNTEFAQNLPIRREQIYLNTQHGTPVKKMGRHQINDKKNRQPKTNRWNYLVTQNSYSTEIFRDAYMYGGKVLETGYPRNDILITHNNESLISDLRKKNHFPTGKKVVLYAPTWREDGSNDFVNLERLNKALPSEFSLAVRLHHLALESINIPSDVINVSGPTFDMQELCLLADILITDYSSVMFDYAVLNRPIILFAPDYDEYCQSRGLYFDLRTEGPGRLVETEAELLDAITSAQEDFKKHKDQFNAFKNRFCSLEQGYSSKRVIEALFCDLSGYK